MVRNYYQMKKKLIIKKGDKVLNVEFLDFRSSNGRSIPDDLKQNILLLSRKVGQDPGDQGFRWFENASYVSLATHEGSLVAFTICKVIEKDVLLFSVAMVLPDYQKLGLQSKMGFFQLRNHYIQELRRKHFLPTLYVIFRTQNPVLYYTWDKQLNIFPKINTEVPSYIKTIAINVVKKCWPDANFDPSTLVINNAYQKTPGLIIKPDSIPKSKNNEINNFIMDRLDLLNHSIKALLILGKVSTPVHHIKIILGSLFI
jgi:hypothetical protein